MAIKSIRNRILWIGSLGIVTHGLAMIVMVTFYVLQLVNWEYRDGISVPIYERLRLILEGFAITVLSAIGIAAAIHLQIVAQVQKRLTHAYHSWILAMVMITLLLLFLISVPVAANIACHMPTSGNHTTMDRISSPWQLPESCFQQTDIFWHHISIAVQLFATLIGLCTSEYCRRRLNFLIPTVEHKNNFGIRPSELVTDYSELDDGVVAAKIVRNALNDAQMRRLDGTNNTFSMYQTIDDGDMAQRSDSFVNCRFDHSNNGGTHSTAATAIVP